MTTFESFCVRNSTLRMLQKTLWPCTIFQGVQFTGANLTESNKQIKRPETTLVGACRGDTNRMGLNGYEKALALMNRHPELQHFVGARNETLIAAAETALGLKFPLSYRRFLLDLGAGSFGAFEIYGVIDAEFENSSVPNGIWCTLQERRDNLPRDLVIVGSDGTGGYYCLDCGNSPNEGSIVGYHVGYPPHGESREIIAPDFGEFFLQRVQEQLEDQ